MVELTPPSVKVLPLLGTIRPWRALRCLGLACAAAMVPATASSQKVRVTNLSDVNFGLVANLQADSERSQSICVYSNGQTSSYSVSASGSGTGSEFELSNGIFTLPYQVEWSDSAGQSTGTALSPNMALTGQVSSATNQFCSAGPPASASLTIVLRASDLSRAREGSYSGSLNLLIAAE